LEVEVERGSPHIFRPDQTLWPSPLDQHIVSSNKTTGTGEVQPRPRSLSILQKASYLAISCNLGHLRQAADLIVTWCRTKEQVKKKNEISKYGRIITIGIPAAITSTYIVMGELPQRCQNIQPKPACAILTAESQYLPQHTYKNKAVIIF